MTFITYLSSPLGTLTLGSDGHALTMLRLEKTPPSRELVLRPELALWQPVQSWLDRYWAGSDPGPCPLPLQPSGTDFQKRIWALARKIPYGETLTYGQLAQETGIPTMSAQAVGGALGKNPIAILIPCHRVLGSGGRLTGYAYGLEAKKALLGLENRGLLK